MPMSHVKNYEWGEGVFNLLSWFKKDKVISISLILTV